MADIGGSARPQCSAAITWRARNTTADTELLRPKALAGRFAAHIPRARELPDRTGRLQPWLHLCMVCGDGCVGVGLARLPDSPGAVDTAHHRVAQAAQAG